MILGYLGRKTSSNHPSPFAELSSARRPALMQRPGERISLIAFSPLLL